MSSAIQYDLRKPKRVKVHDRAHEHERIDSIEHATVAWDEHARVLDANRALQE